MKIKIEDNLDLKRIIIHLDEEVSTQLLGRIRELKGVTVANVTPCDKYSMTVYKGEMFAWSDIKLSIEKTINQ